MKILKEDILIPDVVDAIDVVELTPEGPARGILNANLGNNDDLRDILAEIMADENSILGKLQTMLKVVSPNAVEIMNGAVEAEEQISESYIKRSKKRFKRSK